MSEVHAPTSGTARAVRSRPVPPAGLSALLVAGAAIVALPAVVRQAAPLPAALVLALVAVGGVAVWWVARTGRLPSSLERRAWLGVAAGAFALLALLLAVLDGAGVVALVAPTGALVAALSTLPGRLRRWSCQAVVLSAVAAGFTLHARPVAQTAFAVAVLASIALVAEVFTAELVRARAAEADARRTAERRAELLETARGLPGSSVEAAAEAVVATLRSLAFDAAGVAVAHDDVLEAIHLDGIPRTNTPVPRGRGVSWQAIERDETIVLADYLRSEQRLTDRQMIRSTVVTPVRVDAQPVGTLMCARREPAQPSEAEVEIAEVLADHLGGVFAAARRRERQAELLARVEELDRMRTGLVEAVSAELRDPLTVVRGLASVLRAHGDRLPPGERRVFLDRLGAQTADLRRVVDAILDFSRFQAQRRSATVEAAPLAEVLAPLVAEHEVELAPALKDLPSQLSVWVDPQLLRFGLQLLVERRLDTDGRVRSVRLDVEPEQDSVVLVRRAEASPPISTLTVSLASQVLVAAGATVTGVDVGSDARVRLPCVDAEVAR